MDSCTENEKNKPESAEDLVLDLNFVPQWARKPADGNPYADYAGGDSRGGRRDRRDRGPRSGGASRGGGRSGSGGDRRSKGPNDRSPSRPQDSGGERRFEARREQAQPEGDDRREQRRPAYQHARRRAPLPFRLAFIPDRRQLGALVRQLRHGTRAYPLSEIAHLLLSKPAYCMVKFEARNDWRGGDREHGAPELYHCKQCGQLFLNQAALQSHILGVHFGDFFDAEDQETEAPSGQFVVIARCSLGGELLGPPNHHSYNDKLRILHAERYAHMPFDDYLKRIESVRDPEQIEKWKQEAAHRTVYFRKDTREPENGLTRKEAEAEYQSGPAANMGETLHRAVVSGTLAATLSDAELQEAVQYAWKRESDQPRSMIMALRPAFRHMGLHIFKAGGHEFVSAVTPHPLDPSHAVDFIREVHLYLEEHPGSSREDMLNELRPGLEPESEPVVEILRALHWLVEKGHVIEFFDGTMALPSSRRNK